MCIRDRLPLAVVIIQVPFLVFVLVTAFLALRHEHKLIVTYLQGESPPVVHPEELERLVPARRRAWHSMGLLLRFQLKAWWRTRQRNALLIRLAFEKWHMDAEVEGEAEDARAHAVRVRDLRQALKEFEVA